MVRPTINDWYTNAEDDGGYAAGRDWANDDRPDRGPDSWLDRALSTRRSGAAAAPAPVGSERRSVASSPTSRNARRAPSRTSTRTPKISQAEFMEAVRAIRASQPRIGEKGITKILRSRSGAWANVGRRDVRSALQRLEVTPGTAQQQSPQAVDQKAKPGKRSGRAAGGGRDAPHRKARRAAGAPAAMPSHRPLPRPIPNRPIIIAPLPGPTKSLDAVPPVQADLCPSCGVRVSIIGTCRCS